MHGHVPLLATILFAAPSFGEDAFPTFQPHLIDPFVGKVCYAVTVADVDGDGNQDIVAVSENRVLWYQNPSWEKRIIIQDQTPNDNVCIAPFDIDGDKQIDFAIGAAGRAAAPFIGSGASRRSRIRGK